MFTCLEFKPLIDYIFKEFDYGQLFSVLFVLPVGDCCSYWFDFVGGTHFSGFSR